MLLRLRDFIIREKIVSTQQLMREFCIDLPALQPMLQCWVNKGLIRQCIQKNACQTACFRCKKEPILYYEVFTV